MLASEHRPFFKYPADPENGSQFFTPDEQSERNEELCRNIINDMNTYGLSVVDDFLGLEKGLRILNEVHGMYAAGVFKDGQLVSSNQMAEQDLRTIRGDKITWVTGVEPNCANVGYLINQDVLFPYATNHSKEYLQNNWNEDTIKQIVSDLIALPEFKDFQIELKLQNDSSLETIAKFVSYLIEKDLKLGPLKTLQGLVWNQAYASETVKGHIYNDVPQAFERWTKEGLKICIYSSGSVKAQKLLFGNSEYGDLMPFLSDYFDTAIGHKREPASYTNIVRKLDVPSQRILFLTDIIAEGEAAQKAGLQVIILDRPGNAQLSDDDRSAFALAKDFNEIEIKRV